MSTGKKTKPKTAKSSNTAIKTNKRKVIYITGGRIMRGGRFMDVQSVTFDKQYWDPRRAKSWLREHGFKSPSVDETAGQLRFRQRQPKYDSYATKKISPTINLVLGIS